MATILVTDSGLGTGITIIRSLGRAGHLVIAADSRRGGAGFRSRYVKHRVHHPRGGTDPIGFVGAIADAVARHRVDLIFPVTEEHTLPLVGHEREIGCRIAIPDVAGLELMRDKLRSMELARQLGIPTPETEQVTDIASARDVAERLGWPVVVKPRFSRVVDDAGRLHALQVSYANSPRELEERLAPLLQLGDVLLQRYHPGEGHGVELLLSAGRPLDAFQHHRLHEVPISGGASAYRESVPLDPQLLDHATRLMAHLAWTGLAMVEFRVGETGPQLLEVNGRVWGSLPLAVKSGVDFPARYVDLLLAADGSPQGGPQPSPMGRYRVGVRSHNLQLELVWIGSVLGGRRAYPYLPAPPRMAGLRALLGLLRPSEHDVLSLDDPWPGLADLVAATTHAGGKVIGRA